MGNIGGSMRYLNVLPRKKSSYLMTVITTLVLSGCTTHPGDEITLPDDPNMTVNQAIMSSHISSKGEIHTGVNHLMNADFKQASLTFNRAILDDPTNPHL